MDPFASAPVYYRQMTNLSYEDGSMAIARFNASDWPAAQVDIQKTMIDVLNGMLVYVNQRTF